jgi:DNA-directed RNA polymerase specialized sigma24 family protein
VIGSTDGKSTHVNTLSIPVTELARRCAEEMTRFRRRQRHDPRHCYELFRRALAQRDEEAWTAIYAQYHRLVRHWLRGAPGDPDALVNRAFGRLWKAISPDRFAGFPDLDRILAYLKRCAQCVALDARRQEEREEVEKRLLDGTHEEENIEQVLDQIVGEQLYARAMDRLSGLQEQIVFRATFEWDLKPGEIAHRWPDAFVTPREVSRVKERILRRLQRDETLHALLGMAEMAGDGRCMG